MGKVKEFNTLVKNIFILMLHNQGIECPSNYEDICDFITDDIITNNPNEFNSLYLGSTILSGYKKWKAMNDTGTGKTRIIPNVPKSERSVLHEGFDSNEAKNEIIKIIQSGLYGTVPPEIKGISKIELQKHCNEKFDKPIVLGYGDKLQTVGELRKLMSDLDANDIVVIQSIDLDTGDVEDLYPMNLDVIEGIKLSSGSIVREVRFCQMMNQAPDTRDKQPVIDALIETFEPMTDTTVLEELLKTIPFETLLHSLPEEDWVKYRYLQKPEPENIWSEVKSDYEDDDKICIDAYLTPDDNENGSTIAKVDKNEKNVVYFDQRARDDKYAQEVIQEALKRVL